MEFLLVLIITVCRVYSSLQYQFLINKYCCVISLSSLPPQPLPLYAWIKRFYNSVYFFKGTYNIDWPNTVLFGTDFVFGMTVSPHSFFHCWQCHSSRWRTWRLFFFWGEVVLEAKVGVDEEVVILDDNIAQTLNVLYTWYFGSQPFETCLL